MHEVEIREATFREAANVHNRIPEFEKQDEEFFRERCEGKKTLIIVAYVEDKPAGYMIAYDRYHDGSIYCWMTAVVPEFRRKGVLKAMMQYLETWARKEGFTKIKIKTRNERREMLAYLVKYGFNFIEVIPKESVEKYRILLEKEII